MNRKFYCVGVEYDNEGKNTIKYVFPHAASKKDAIIRGRGFFEKDGIRVIDLNAVGPYVINELSQDVLDEFRIKRDLDGYIANVEISGYSKENTHSAVASFTKGWMEEII